MINNRDLGFLGIVIGLAGIAYASYIHLKVKETNNMIDISIDNLSKEVNVDVSALVIEKAVTRAVDREVNKAVNSISYEVQETIRKDINNKVRNAVSDAYSDIRGSVSKEVAKEVANLNMESLRKKVKEEAKQLVLDKFNENLDSLLEDFNQNLTNVSKIYGSIADNMVKKPQETVFKIGI